MFALLLATWPPPTAKAQPSTLLIDTGPGVTGAGLALIPTNVSNGNFQLLAARFTLQSTTYIDAIHTWMTIGQTGVVGLSIRRDASGVPGSLVATRSQAVFFNSTPRWEPFVGLNVTLPAGNYWFSIESASAFGAVDYGVPNPLSAYAVYFRPNGRWANVATTGSPGAFGLRVYGTANSVPAPQPPTALVAHSIAGHRVTLRWRPPIGGPSPTSYVLEGGVAPGQVLAALSNEDSRPVFTFDAPTGAFYLRVRSVAAGQTSSPSSEIRVYVNQAEAPSPATVLLGLANNSGLALSWRNTFAGGPPTDAILEVGGAVSTSLPLGETETFSFNAVPPGTYSFAVRSTNAFGASTASNSVTLTFPGTCAGPPQLPTNVVAQSVGGMVTLLWDPPATGPAATSYQLRVAGTISTTLPISGRTIGGTLPAGVYTFVVSAVNACGTSATSAPHTLILQ